MKIRIVTLNLLFDDWRRWERLDLAIAEIKRLDPDFVLLQEVDSRAGVPARLGKQLPGYHLSLAARHGQAGHIAQVVLSKPKPIAQADLRLSQERLAQKVSFKIGGKTIDFINVHLYFSPFRDKPRRLQIEHLLKFANNGSIIAGDFNVHPLGGSIRLIEERFDSAYLAVNGREPAKTSPTPLWRGRGLRHSLRRGALKAAAQTQRGTIDYIFVGRAFKVESCRLAFGRPAPDDASLYASDHYGLVADLIL